MSAATGACPAGTLLGFLGMTGDWMDKLSAQGLRNRIEFAAERCVAGAESSWPSLNSLIGFVIHSGDLRMQ